MGLVILIFGLVEEQNLYDLPYIIVGYFLSVEERIIVLETDGVKNTNKISPFKH